MTHYYIHTKLAFEMVMLAIKDLGTDLQDESIEWFKGNVEEPYISFKEICEVLGWDHDLVLSRVLDCNNPESIKELVRNIRKTYRISRRGR